MIKRIEKEKPTLILQEEVTQHKGVRKAEIRMSDKGALGFK